MASDLPYYEKSATASYGGQSQYNNLYFSNFKNSTTFCGADQRLFRLNPKSPDYSPRASFTGVTFNNVDQDAMFYLFSPPWAWANLNDCGNYPCTGPNNTMLTFSKAKFTGSTIPMKTNSQFQIVPFNA